MCNVSFSNIFMSIHSTGNAWERNKGGDIFKALGIESRVLAITIKIQNKKCGWIKDHGIDILALVCANQKIFCCFLENILIWELELSSAHSVNYQDWPLLRSITWQTEWDGGPWSPLPGTGWRGRCWSQTPGGPACPGPAWFLELTAWLGFLLGFVYRQDLTMTWLGLGFTWLMTRLPSWQRVLKWWFIFPCVIMIALKCVISIQRSERQPLKARIEFIHQRGRLAGRLHQYCTPVHS